MNWCVYRADKLVAWGDDAFITLPRRCLDLLPRYYHEFWPFSCQLKWGRAGPPAMPTRVDPAKMPSEYRPWRPGSASLAQSRLC